MSKHANQYVKERLASPLTPLQRRGELLSSPCGEGSGERCHSKFNALVGFLTAA